MYTITFDYVPDVPRTGLGPDTARCSLNQPLNVLINEEIVLLKVLVLSRIFHTQKIRIIIIISAERRTLLDIDLLQSSSNKPVLRSPHPTCSRVLIVAPSRWRPIDTTSSGP